MVTNYYSRKPLHANLNTNNNTVDNNSFLHLIAVKKYKTFCNHCGKTFKMEISNYCEEMCQFCSCTFSNPSIQSHDYIYSSVSYCITFKNLPKIHHRSSNSKENSNLTCVLIIAHFQTIFKCSI